MKRKKNVSQLDTVTPMANELVAIHVGGVDYYFEDFSCTANARSPERTFQVMGRKRITRSTSVASLTDNVENWRDENGQRILVGGAGWRCRRCARRLYRRLAVGRAYRRSVLRRGVVARYVAEADR